MNNLIRPFAIAASLLLFSACDKLEDPIIRLDNQYLEGVYGPAPEFEVQENPTKNVLVEEFTGHLCGFCPAATSILKNLDTQYGSRIVALGIHAGTLAAVSSPPFETDYNTEVGDVYWAQLINGFNPSARIDRSGGNSFFYIDNQWTNKIMQQMEKPVTVAMQMITEYIPEDKNLNIHVHSQFLEDMQGTYSLVVLLAESHIISAQLDYAQTPSEIEDYEHNHVLRTGVTGALGQPLLTDPRLNDQPVRSFTLPMDPSWVPGNCTVAAFIVDNTTEEILNAVESEVVE